MDVERTRGYHDYLALEETIREVAETTGATRILFDRRQMGRTMELLDDEGYPVEEFPQTNDRMCSASQHLYDLAVAGRLRHGGDLELARHAASAAAYARPPLGWRFAKIDRSDSSCKIDGMIALAMACWGAQAEGAAAPSFAETGGVYTYSW
jgi:phage terminase large subunit-like protein